MIQAIIHRLLLRRHFWRYATFSEVAEIYTSRTMRIFALRMVATFTSIYLYQEGYSPVFIALFFGSFFFYKALFAWPAVKIVARVGPKHATFISNILLAASFPFLAVLNEYGIPVLVIWGLLQASSTCLYDLSYLVDFSKVKNIDHAGKEIAFMNILEKVASSVSPLLGGLMAFVAGPEVVMIIASVLLFIAAFPLFKTPEPVPTHQKMQIRGFPWKTTWRSMVAESAVGFDIFSTGTAWTLFMVIVIFVGNGNEIYAKVGALTSVAIVAALAASYAFGRLIDHRRGGELLRFGAILNSIVHVVRAFITTPVGIGLTNAINEATTTGYSMAFIRGIFDTADQTGRRLTYLFFIEITTNLGASLAAVSCALCMWMWGGMLGLQIFFVLAALYTLLIATPRFALYRK